MGARTDSVAAGGTIRVSSAPLKGAVFSVELPVAPTTR